MPISGSLSATRLPPHKKHAALSSGYFSLHCGHDFMERPLPSSPDRLPEERPSSGRPGIAPNRQLPPGSPHGRTGSKRSPGHVPAERRQPLKIEVPDQKQETLRFGRVGVIVTAGFAIGILWPRVAGFKLVPSVPSQPADSSGGADLTGAPADPKSGAPAGSAAAAEVEPPPAETPPNVDRLQVSEPQFVVCKAKGKKKKDDCDHIDFDRLARPHIQALAECQGAEHMEGMLSLGFELDFESQTIKAIKNGK